MKSVLKYIVIAVVVLGTLSFTTTHKQTKETVVAVFDGLEDYGYNFIVKKGDIENTMTFQEVSEDVLLKYDLTSDEFIGKTFKVTYTITIETTEDEDGNDEETELLTIIALEKK